MSELPLVTVLIPARNEDADIEGCLAAVAAQDHPVNRLEIIVIDGGSDDRTADVARRALGRWGFASTAVIRNEECITTPCNLNAGLARAAGTIVCRVDARTRIEPHHVRTCVSVLQARADVAVVGGAQIAVARDASARARGIARALNNHWTMGGSRYRRGASSGASDTVYLGAFRTDDLRALGGWSEQFETNQDFELNRRMAALGLVWYEASLATDYLPRQTYRDLWHQYTRFGRWKARYWRVTGDRPQPRQIGILAAPVLAGVMLLGLFPRRWPIVAGAGLLAVDELGSVDHGARLAERLHAAAAVVVVTGGWTVGAWSGLLAPR